MNELYHRARYVRRVGYDGPPPAPALAPEMCARIDTRLREAGRHSGCARPAVSARGVPNDERR